MQVLRVSQCGSPFPSPVTEYTRIRENEDECSRSTGVTVRNLVGEPW